MNASSPRPNSMLVAGALAFLAGAAILLAGIRLASGTPPPPDPIVLADHAAVALPVIASPLQHAEDPSVAWEAWRAGWVGLGVLALLGIGGAWLHAKRGYVSKRWPWLNIGRAWAVVSILSSAAISMIPLAAAGDLGLAAIKLQVGASLLYLVPGKLGEVTSADGAA